MNTIKACDIIKPKYNCGYLAAQATEKLHTFIDLGNDIFNTLKNRVLDGAEGDINDVIDGLLKFYKNFDYNQYNLCKYMVDVVDTFKNRMEDLKEYFEGEKFDIMLKDGQNLIYALEMGHTILKNVYGVKYCMIAGDLAYRFLDGEKFGDPETFEPTKRYLDFMGKFPPCKKGW